LIFLHAISSTPQHIIFLRSLAPSAAPICQVRG
jgi:hypothetical protein